MESTPTLEQFVDDMLTAKEYQGLDTEVAAQIKSDLVEKANNHINGALVAELSPDQVDQLNQIMAGGDLQQAQQFIADNVENAETVVAAALLRFKSAYQGA